MSLRLGRRGAMMTGAVMFAFSYLVLVVAPNVYFVYVGRWSWRKFGKKLTKFASLDSLLGFALAFVLWFVLVSYHSLLLSSSQ